jgi:hypothetical protein
MLVFFSALLGLGLSLLGIGLWMRQEELRAQDDGRKESTR